MGGRNRAKEFRRAALEIYEAIEDPNAAMIRAALDEAPQAEKKQGGLLGGLFGKRKR